MDIAALERLALRAGNACAGLSVMPAKRKNDALRAMADSLRRRKSEILRENAKDLERARQAGLARVMLNRLTLDESKIEAIAASIVSIAALPDPVGRELWTRRRPNGLKILKVGVPI